MIVAVPPPDTLIVIGFPLEPDAPMVMPPDTKVSPLTMSSVSPACTDPHEMFEKSFHALPLEEQAATLRILAYIHRRDTEDAEIAEIKKATGAE